jgi:hypothetical protein
MKRDKAEFPGPVRSQKAQARVPLPKRVLRWCLNIWIVLHFVGVVAAAASVGPTPGYVVAVWKLFLPYLQFLFLNHGYNFYAPEPSPSTLIAFEAVRPDGKAVKGQIADASIRPRLLYQRHLLLTEHIGIVPEGERQEWYQSYACHLCRKLGVSKVRLTLIHHVPLPMEMFRDGGRLDDPITFDETDLGEFSCDKP